MKTTIVPSTQASVSQLPMPRQRKWRQRNWIACSPIVSGVHSCEMLIFFVFLFVLTQNSLQRQKTLVTSASTKWGPRTRQASEPTLPTVSLPCHHVFHIADAAISMRCRIPLAVVKLICKSHFHLSQAPSRPTPPIEAMPSTGVFPHLHHIPSNRYYPKLTKNPVVRDEYVLPSAKLTAVERLTANW